MGMARALVKGHGGEVPADMDALVELPGVGRKTASVVLGHALGVPALPVDRHVLRVSNRIGIADSDKPEIVEGQLAAALPPERWTRTSDTLILHGRRICKPKPLCDQCAVQDECDFYHAARRSNASSLTLASIPRASRRRWNLVIVVEDEPSRELLRQMEVEPPDTLLGLYQGLPLTERRWDYGNALPDRILLFQVRSNAMQRTRTISSSRSVKR